MTVCAFRLLARCGIVRTTKLRHSIPHKIFNFLAPDHNHVSNSSNSSKYSTESQNHEVHAVSCAQFGNRRLMSNPFDPLERKQIQLFRKQIIDQLKSKGVEPNLRLKLAYAAENGDLDAALEFLERYSDGWRNQEKYPHDEED